MTSRSASRETDPAPREGSERSPGRLKVFLGMAPGVGKTFAMLQDAQDRKDEGIDVVVGLVQTHGRAEIAALLAGIEVLPRRTLPYRGSTREAFDLEGALQRRPALILVDELAHANVQGCRHAHRWQDVWDLLDAGIDVHTTLNIQDLESLRDIVAQITGVVVRDSIPDTLLARADRIELVDIPPEDLQARLREGKVFVPEFARHATERFFRKGNLLALRELALRRAADHVDGQMRRYMEDQGIRRTWAAGERLLVCMTPHPESARLIRATRHLAGTIKAPWMAVHVESGSSSEADQAQMELHLRLVERLGGEALVIQGTHTLAEDLVALAVARNVTRILLGKPRGWRHWFRPSLMDALVRRGGAIDVMVLARDRGEAPPEAPPRPLRALPRARGLRYILPALHLLGSALTVALATLLAWGLDLRGFALADLVMVYLLGIVAAAARFGRWAALSASLLSILSLDWFFLEPRFSLIHADAKHSGTFGVMLVVGLVIGTLAERLRTQVRLARIREQRTQALLALSTDLAGATHPEAVEAALQGVTGRFQSRVALFLPGPNGELHPLSPLDPPLPEGDRVAAQWAFDHQASAGLCTDTLPGARALWIPLRGSRGPLGVLAAWPEDAPRWKEADQPLLLEALASQTALALERAQLTEREGDANRRSQQDQLRLRALDDLTRNLDAPLERIVAAEENEEARRQARALRRKVQDLLDLGALESGARVPERAPLRMESLVSAVLESFCSAHPDQPFRVDLPEHLPEILGDRVLLGRALSSLLENARAFAPGLGLEVRGWATERALTLVVADEGPGLPEGQEDQIFERGFALPDPSGRLGAGLGLPLAKRIVEAHGGWLQGSNRPQGGAQFLLGLPLG